MSAPRCFECDSALTQMPAPLGPICRTCNPAPDSLSAEVIEELEGLLAKASPAPWVYDDTLIVNSYLQPMIKDAVSGIDLSGLQKSDAAKIELSVMARERDEAEARADAAEARVKAMREALEAYDHACQAPFADGGIAGGEARRILIRAIRRTLASAQEAG